jgi:hypothetical protein
MQEAPMSEAPYSPAEPPAEGDRTNQAPPSPNATPRFSASASVPVPPAKPQGSATPPAFGQGYGAQGLDGPAGQGYGGQGFDGPAGQGYGGQGFDGPAGQSPMGQAPLGQAPLGQSLGQPPASGSARVAASASVPSPAPNSPPSPAAAPSNFGTAPPANFPAQPGTYGSPGGSGQPYGSPPAPSPYQPQPSAPQAQFNSAPAPATYGAPPASSPPQPQYGGSYDRPAPMGQGGYSPGMYGQPAADPGQAGRGIQASWPEPEQAKPKSRRGLIITLIIAAVVVVVGIGGYVGWSLTNRGSDFKAGACVKQSGTDSVVLADCTAAGAYKITNIVDTENGCPDANQPTLVLTERVGGNRRWACLTPAATS